MRKVDIVYGLMLAFIAWQSYQNGQVEPLIVTKKEFVPVEKPYPVKVVSGKTTIIKNDTVVYVPTYIKKDSIVVDTFYVEAETTLTKDSVSFDSIGYLVAYHQTKGEHIGTRYYPFLKRQINTIEKTRMIYPSSFSSSIIAGYTNGIVIAPGVRYIDKHIGIGYNWDVVSNGHLLSVDYKFLNIK